MRVVDRLVEAGAVRVPATLVLGAQQAAPGAAVQAGVVGEHVASVALTGCGFDGAVTDTDAAVDGVQFALTVPATWPTSADGEAAESCVFTAASSSAPLP